MTAYLAPGHHLVPAATLQDVVHRWPTAKVAMFDELGLVVHLCGEVAL